jgi:hypothetical protein
LGLRSTLYKPLPHFKEFERPLSLLNSVENISYPSEYEEKKNVGGKAAVMNSLCLCFMFAGMKFPLDCLLLRGRRVSLSVPIVEKLHSF